jgi:hypothetical protein
MTVLLSEAGTAANHLIIPYAASRSPVLQSALLQLELPHLQVLLKALTRVQTDADDLDAPGLDMPHERARALALQLPGQSAWPWAALENQTENEEKNEAQNKERSHAPQAFFSPCHWQIGIGQVVMRNPASLQLSDAESQALLAAMQPFLTEDGLTVRYLAPTQWHVQGEMLLGLACASLERVVGMDVNPWLPKSAAAKALRRLQSEMQMLLYNHPVNDARSARGQLTVNSFWVHGAGVLTQPSAAPAPYMTTALREAALREDAQAWLQAWREIDATLCAKLCADLYQRTGMGMATQPVTLTLCSEHAAHTYQATAQSSLQQLWQRAQRVFQPLTVQTALLAL